MWVAAKTPSDTPWQPLGAHPHMSSAELSLAAGTGSSTESKVQPLGEVGTQGQPHPGQQGLLSGCPGDEHGQVAAHPGGSQTLVWSSQLELPPAPTPQEDKWPGNQGPLKAHGILWYSSQDSGIPSTHHGGVALPFLSGTLMDDQLLVLGQPFILQQM